MLQKNSKSIAKEQSKCRFLYDRQQTPFDSTNYYIANICKCLQVLVGQKYCICKVAEVSVSGSAITCLHLHRQVKAAMYICKTFLLKKYFKFA